jgi:hypothetical protein
MVSKSYPKRKIANGIIERKNKKPDISNSIRI